MSKEIQFDGTIRTVEKIDREKKSTSEQIGHLVIMNEEGDKIDIRGNVSITQGYAPEEQVTIKVSRTNKTLKEALKK